MKELLSKLIGNYVVIFFKSGEKIEDLLIEAVMENVIVGSVDGKIIIIELSHIACVMTEAGVVDIVQTILKSEENKKDEDKDGKKDDKKTSKKRHHD